MGTKPSRSGHLPINGLSLYHEVYGELGKSKPSPLLLIPGAFMATDSMTSWVSAFAGKRAVIVFDQQGHGRTPDTSRKMSYEQFGDDAAALLRALKVERADVMGYSQGGADRWKMVVPQLHRQVLGPAMRTLRSDSRGRHPRRTRSTPVSGLPDRRPDQPGSLRRMPPSSIGQRPHRGRPTLRELPTVADRRVRDLPPHRTVHHLRHDRSTVV